ncbi:MAG TPA: ATP-dependent RNA helicase [Sphaerochaetaceae bacterium]|nr:ATP-dependent RNA helicase [Sphaerochaetaceae bacterium]
MTHLPVYQHRKEILEALANNQVIVVESPTGSGKTTQLPLILNEAGYTKNAIVGVTQPRRIATLSVSEFITRQLDAEQGYVGYKMRFSDTTERNTKIKVMTDGILLMELKADPLLSHYSVMLVDEAHERSLNIDFVLGLLKRVLKERPDFKVIVSSATINTKIFSDFFDHAPIISIDARIHPVEVRYSPIKRTENPEELFTTIVSTVEKRMQESDGDILIFLPGEFDIKTCMQHLQSSSFSRKLHILPLFGRLSKEEQERVFIPTPKGKTKVVVATNIAETSVTIDGITTVIDSGIAKINYYNQKNFTSSLVSLPISRSSCEQRAGRAGRTAPGVCIRLYERRDFIVREQFGLEEILRTDLSEVVLRMSELGIFDYEYFPFITRPKASAISSAEQTLRFIEAIDDKRQLTTIGEHMVRFPLLPRHARVVVEAMLHYPNVMQEVLIAIAFLSSKTPFIFPPGFEDEARKAHQSFNSEQGDFISYVHLYKHMRALPSNEAREAYCKKKYLDYPSMAEIHHVAEQLASIVSDIGVPIGSGGSTKDYLCCLAAGLLQFVCVRAKRSMYKSLTADQIYIHPGSAWFKEMPQFLLAGEIVQTSRMYARTVSPLKKEWLETISPGLGSRLLGLREEERKSGKQVRREKSERIAQEGSRNMVTLYKREYPMVNASKGKRRVVVIPYEDLSYLAIANKGASKRPKNFPAAILYHNQYIHFGDKFFQILELNGKIDPSKGILESPPSGTFTAGDPRPLIDNLMWILALCKLKKKQRQLGFVQFNAQGNGVYRFSSTRNGFEALDSSLYALGQLVDEVDGSTFSQELRLAKKAFEHYLRLFDD